MKAIFLVACCTVLASGCTAPWYRQSLSEPYPLLPAATTLPEAQEDASLDTPTPSPRSTEPSHTVDETALARVIAELEAAGPLDPELKQGLVADLRKTKPELWEATVQVYRSAIAYRQQLAQREPEPEPILSAAAAEEAVVSAASQTAHEKAVDRLPAALEILAPPPAPPTDVYPDPKLPPELLGHASQVVRAEAENVTAQLSPKPDHETSAPVQPVSHTSEPAAVELTWQEHLEEAIAGLEAAAGSNPQNLAGLRHQVALRMLCLAAGQREEALQPIAGLSPAQQDFWAKQFYGLATYLDHEQLSDPGDRAAAALHYLNDATAQLAELSTLRVRNLAFCSEVKSYGVYTKFDKYEFRPQQEVLLYAEVENFRSEETEEGFVTALRSSYQILDSRGQRVEAKEFPVTEELCQSRRRDFFMRYFIWIPKRIYDGTYTLQLTIEDVKNQKFNQASIEFEVKEAGS